MARLGAANCLLSTPKRTPLNQVLTVSDRPTAAIQRLPYQYQRTDRRALELSPEVVSIL